MNYIKGGNVPELYAEAIINMKNNGVVENTRNGPVLAMQGPTILELTDPRRRVLFDEVRDANPFYHVMETIWMLAGGRDITWLEQFNKGIANYCDPGTSYWHGAYGYRWRANFGIDQIHAVIRVLQEDPLSRRAVLGMWDPAIDMDSHNDLPCNTHIYFRATREGELDMLVCNRSNDLVWGALGANVVHMTFLHEMIASAVDMELGTYRVITNNLHIYKNLKNFDKIMDTWGEMDAYHLHAAPVELLAEDELYKDLLEDCEQLIDFERPKLKTAWGQSVALPMRDSYFNRKSGGTGISHANQIQASDWRIACLDYIQRRGTSSSPTSTEPSP